MGGSTFRRAAQRRSAQTYSRLGPRTAVLIGDIGLATDVGNLYLNYIRSQTAADASVLAGASHIPNQPGRAASTADSYVCLYGVAPPKSYLRLPKNDPTLCPPPPVADPPPCPFQASRPD